MKRKDFTSKLKYKGNSYKRKRKVLNLYSREIESALPKSEQWFRQMWCKEFPLDKHDRFNDKYNSPYGNFIPDLINHGYKYVIEIDGSWHNQTQIQSKDQEKDKHWKAAGYMIFRIKHNDLDQYKHVVELVKARRKEIRPGIG